MDPRLDRVLEGRYTIEREIGAGGMATVYLARDLRHNRRVALKILNPELGAVLGAERFLAEIQMTANLQHPNLLPLFDSGEAAGLLFYVMPFVEGESLRVRLERERHLPVDEAVRIASAIAAALDYAHRHKVIHRDLKPENILMHEGQPLIADFGIALALSNAGGARITQTGLSLGTPQYMSPEQATGERVVDGRADIYSLGAITYEMLVGDPPHVASTTHGIIAKLLTEKPSSVRTIRSNVPAHVDSAIGCALEKLPADRFSTAREFADTLQGRLPVRADEASARSPSRGQPSQRDRTRELVAWSLAIMLGAMLAWQWIRPRETTVAPVIRTALDLPAGARVNDVLSGTTIAMSRAGDMIAFTAVSPTGFRMYVRHVGESAPREVSTAAGRNLTFSPDGRWIAFTEGNAVYKVSVDGGQVATVGATSDAVPYGLAWSESDTIYAGTFTGMLAIPVGSGKAVVVPDPDSGDTRVGKRWPVLLPGGRFIAFASGANPAAATHLAVLDLRTGKSEYFEIPIAVPLGVLDEHLVYVSPAGGLMAMRFDASKNRPVGQPVQLDEGVLVDPTAGAKASVSASGTLAYLRGRAQFQPLLVSPGGTSVSPVLREPGTYSTPRYSPDGGRVAMTVFGANSTDIWIYHFGRNTFTRLTTEGANVRPEWTADGRRVVFVSTRTGRSSIWSQPADGSGAAEELYRPEAEPYEALVSPDMKWLIFRTAPGVRFPRDILAVPMGADRTVVPIVTGPYTDMMPRLSPDGRWLAYQTNETGRFEIYVRPFPASGARVQVSDKGGSEPMWGRSGRSLYFRGPVGEVVEVSVTTGDEFSIGPSSVVLTGDYLTDASHPNYDVSPDGRLLMLKRAGAESQTIIVHNWRAELRRKTAAR